MEQWDRAEEERTDRDTPYVGVANSCSDLPSEYYNDGKKQYNTNQLEATSAIAGRTQAGHAEVALIANSPLEDVRCWHCGKKLLNSKTKVEP